MNKKQRRCETGKKEKNGWQLTKGWEYYIRKINGNEKKERGRERGKIYINEKE